MLSARFASPRRHADRAVRRRPMGGWAVARPVRRRRGRQHDALRADVRRLRARTGGRRHGTPAGGTAVRVATHPERRAAALSPGTVDDLFGSWRPRRRPRRAGCHGSALHRRHCCCSGPHCSWRTSRAFCRDWIARRPAGHAPSPGWRSTPSGGYPLGVVLGFLPCGFLYAALTTTAASGSPLLGALGMLAFGLGTVPALVAVGVAGHAAGRRWQRGVAVAAPVAMLLNAALLTALALRGLVIDM